MTPRPADAKIADSNENKKRCKAAPWYIALQNLKIENYWSAMEMLAILIYSAGVWRFFVYYK